MQRFLILILLFFPIMAWSAERPTQLQFADSLSNQGDHYRAITEYKRFIFLQPDSPLRPNAELSIAQSLIAGQRWQAADAALELLFVHFPASSETAQGRRLYADSAYDRGAFGLARERYRALLKHSPNPALIDYANFKIGWTFLEQDRPQQAKTPFSLLPTDQQAPLLTELKNYQALELKSPKIAGTLSTLLPGLGQVYTGRYKQAALSFLLNGAFVLGALEAFDNENYAVGGILLFFEIGWYGGNVYNAINNAHKFNARSQHRFRKQMSTRLKLHLGLRQQTPLMILSYRF